jgi:HTH-type transcriptional regulator/antitoxin HigA
LIQAYEAEHYPIAAPDPIDFIRHLMEARGLTRKDLEPYIGSRARVSEVLNRNRPLTLEMIRRLSDGLDIPADILVRRYPLTEAA